jgi:hypothetical protein
METKNLASVFWIRHPDRSRRFGSGAAAPDCLPLAGCPILPDFGRVGLLIFTADGLL